MEFARYVESFRDLYLHAKNESEPVLSRLSSSLSWVPKRILILAPHPDDECLMGGFAVRAQEEYQTEVFVLPYSFGSNHERRHDRRKELEDACRILGFRRLEVRANDLCEPLREDEIFNACRQCQCDGMIAVHPEDGHPTHVRSAQLARNALKRYAEESGQETYLLQSEFWQSLPNPNLLIPLSSQHLSRMGEALLMHVGEVVRNPYHLTLPPWAMEQVRRGSEMILNENGDRAIRSEKAQHVFGQLYHVEKVLPNEAR